MAYHWLGLLPRKARLTRLSQRFESHLFRIALPHIQSFVCGRIPSSHLHGGGRRPITSTEALMNRHQLEILARLTKASPPHLGQRGLELRSERLSLDDVRTRQTCPKHLRQR